MPRGGIVGARGTLEERLLKRVVCEIATRCWTFTGSQRGGYGLIGIATGRCAIAHRVGYELWVGPIPDGHELHHICRNRACINPDHLMPVSRMTHQHIEPTSMANRTHCKAGHPLAGDNLVPSRLKVGVRQCRECVRAAAKRCYAKHAEAKSDYARRNRDRINEGVRRRYAADPTRFLEYQRQWKAKRKPAV